MRKQPVTISHQLRRHLNCLGKERPSVICVGSRREIERAEAEIRSHRRKADVISVELPCNDIPAFAYDHQGHSQNMAAVRAAVRDPQIEQTDIVLLCGETINNVNVQHTATGLLKAGGKIVVSCFARPLFMTRPNDTAGLTYPGIFTRVGNLMSAMPQRGDYLEFGVFDGRTITLAWHCMNHVEGMRFFAFDSFSGISGGLDPEKTLYPDGSFTSNLTTFHHNLQVADVDKDRVVAVAGDFQDTLRDSAALHGSLGLNTCLVAHFDADVYRPTKLALDFVTDSLVQGSILLFDEFHANAADNQLGERRALREWLDENPHIEVERYHDYAAAARAFIVHISD